MGYRRHWIALALVVAGSFAVLGGLGPRIAGGAPPIPARVVLPDGRVLLVPGGRRVAPGSTEEDEGAVAAEGRA